MPSKRATDLLFRMYPELARFERWDQATEALTRAKHEVMRTGRFWLLNVALFLGTMIAAGVAVRLLARDFAPLSAWVDDLTTAIPVAVVVGTGFWSFRRRIRRFLREELATLGVAVCIRCGYDLRGQIEPRCPECGTPFNPELLETDHQPPPP